MTVFDHKIFRQTSVSRRLPAEDIQERLSLPTSTECTLPSPTFLLSGIRKNQNSKYDFII